MTPPPALAELLYLLQGDPSELMQALAGMRSADVAEALRDLAPEGAAKVMSALPFDLAVRVLDEPELVHHRRALVARMGVETAGPLIDAMSADQQADLFRELGTPERQRLLQAVDDETRRTMHFLLDFSPDTAGGIMTTEFTSVLSTATVADTLRDIAHAAPTRETIYTIYVLNVDDRSLIHVVSLRELMTAPPESLALAVGTRRSPITVRTGTDREETARLISKYNLLAVPVVDEGNHVLGIVTVDDVIDAIVSEQTEDVQKFGGMEALGVPYTQIGLGAMVKKRAGWLAALFLGEMLTATAMGHFEGEIEKAAVLALFVPLIISSGGNSGSQATSLIIRALALHEISLRDWWRIAARELPSGIILGAILGVIGIARIALWQWIGWFNYGAHWRLVAATVGGALIGVVTFGSLAGSMLPFILKRLGFDPASASAPFVATLVDVTGLVIYFSVALVILRGTLL